MKRYYKAIVSHNCSFKFELDNGADACSLVSKYLINQNKGETKSDRLSLIDVHRITEAEYKSLNWVTHKF